MRLLACDHFFADSARDESRPQGRYPSAALQPLDLALLTLLYSMCFL